MPLRVKTVVRAAAPGSGLWPAQDRLRGEPRSRSRRNPCPRATLVTLRRSRNPGGRCRGNDEKGAGIVGSTRGNHDVLH